MFSPAAFWSAKRRSPPVAPPFTVPSPKRSKALDHPTPITPSSFRSDLSHVPTPKSRTPDRLGKFISLASTSLAEASSWYSFIAGQQAPSDLQPDITSRITHPAAPFLAQIAQHGVPILQDNPPWTRARLDAAISRGSHPSTLEHMDFLREEMADMVAQKHWVVIPYDQALLLPNLCLSPMGVVPQRDRRPRVIVDFTFSGVNLHTLKSLAPTEAMQFGRALDRILYQIHHANRRFGPVHLIKVDIADGFYRIRVSASHMPTLAVAFPNQPGEPRLVAIPLVLPMGWVSSPPFFCAATETAADVANSHLRDRSFQPIPHPLRLVADSPNNLQPVSPPVSTIATAHIPLPVPLSGRSFQPPQTTIPSAPLAYVDLYMDDFLGLAQGHPGLRERVRSTLFHSIDQIFRPLTAADTDGVRREPISVSKLNKGDAQWATRKCLLGWVIDTVRETIELPEHRRLRLHDILLSLLSRSRVSIKVWQQSLGELRSMILALPGGQGFFSALYTGYSQLPTSSDSRIRITQPIRDTLLDLQHLATDLAHRPTRIGEVVDTLPVAYSAADACGTGMGGIWFSPDPAFRPILWRHPFDPSIIPCLVTTDNPTGSVTNSDLELAAQIATTDVLLQHFNCVERSIATFTDNISARAWLRKGSKTTHGPAAYLLRIHALLQRHFRCRSTIDYVPGPANAMADDASRLWHLSDLDLLTHFNSTFPQAQPWLLCHLRPEMHSALTMALQCKRSLPALFLPEHVPATLPGFSGNLTVPSTKSTPFSPMWSTPYPSSKSLPNVTAPGPLPPIKNLSSLAPWKRHSAPSPRRSPAWGPQTRV